MKFKTKYNCGDIVIFETISQKDWEMGIIDDISVKYDFQNVLSARRKETIEYGIKTYIDIDGIRVSVNDGVCKIKRVKEYEIRKKLNKKAFEEMFSKECAKKIKNVKK